MTRPPRSARLTGDTMGLLLGMQAAIPLLAKADQPAIVNNLS
jgi:hypothetical protein